jgi:hypothetical protein
MADYKGLFASLSPEKKAEIDQYINDSMIGMGGSGIRNTAKYGAQEAPGLWAALKRRIVGEKPLLRPDIGGRMHGPDTAPVIPQAHPYPQALEAERNMDFLQALESGQSPENIYRNPLKPGYGKGN